MSPKKPTDDSTARAEAAIDELVHAFADVVSAEVRFGARQDCRSDLSSRWRGVIERIRRLK